MAEFVKVEGLKNVEKLLTNLGPALGFKALRSGMMAASRPMFLAAKANAAATGLKGYDSDAMAAAMSRGTRKVTPNRTTLWIGPKNKHKKALAIYNSYHGTDLKRLPYFHLVEWGAERGEKGSMSAQPFMRPAFAATSRMVVSNLGDEIRKAVDKVKRKHASK
jgi:HK97 gp10 family phage protein